jgi:hypothetical protein
MIEDTVQPDGPGIESWRCHSVSVDFAKGKGTILQMYPG